MTQEELDALPEDGTIQMVEVEVDGVRALMPQVVTVGALWAADDEPCSVVDSEGTRWMVGWVNGVRYKRKALALKSLWLGTP